MTTYVQIKDKQTLLRDINSKAILNTDKNGLQEYITKREVAKKQSQEQAEMKHRLSSVEKDLSEIKRLLQEIVQLRNVNGN